MDKKYDKDLKFLFRALVFSAAVLIGMQLVQPWIAPSDPQAAEIREMTQQIVSLRGSEVSPLLRGEGGKPVMLVVYASWCGYCKQLMPRLAEMMRDGSLDRVSPLFLSVDNQLGMLGAYLVESGYGGLFTPYAVKLSGMNGLPDALLPTGSAFKGYIPYIAFFDRQGKMVAELPGVPKKEQLLAAMRQAQQAADLTKK